MPSTIERCLHGITDIHIRLPLDQANCNANLLLGVTRDPSRDPREARAVPQCNIRGTAFASRRANNV